MQKFDEAQTSFQNAVISTQESHTMNTFALYANSEGRVILASSNLVPKGCKLIEMITAIDRQEAREQCEDRFVHKDGYGFYE